MTTRYCGPGGNDASDGLTWANRKLTLTGLEDSPVEAGDICYVAPGTYRELLTCDVDGSSGSPITYIGDYTGANTDGTGGVVRITGSDDDQSIARENCVANTKSYRTFQGIAFGEASTACIGITTTAADVTNLIVDECYFQNYAYGIYVSHTTNTLKSSTIKNSYFYCKNDIYLSVTSGAQIDANNVIENNILRIGERGNACFFNRVIGGTIRNNLFQSGDVGVLVQNATDNTVDMIVNNNIFVGINTAFLGVTGNFGITEDYNNLYSVAIARSNVATGANSNTFPGLFDSRWFFELVNGGTLLTPFDLASYSELVDVAGTSPTTADMRGTTVQGTQREWGALEYDSTLDIEAGSGGGGAVKIIPITGKVGL